MIISGYSSTALNFRKADQHFKESTNEKDTCNCGDNGYRKNKKGIYVPEEDYYKEVSRDLELARRALE